MGFGEKLQYITGIETIFMEKDAFKRNMYLDELINISTRNGPSRETEILKKYRYNKNGMRNYAIRKSNGYVFHEMLATAYEEGIRKNTKANMSMQIVGDYVVADDVLIMYTGRDTKIIVPENIRGTKIRRIGTGAFYGNKAIEKLEVSDGIKEIGALALAECSSLKSVELPPSVESIPLNLLQGSEALWSVTFYKELTSEIYDEIAENGIKLTDGSRIIDPMVLGNGFVRMIRGFMPGVMSGRFRVDRSMGCLFEVRPKTIDAREKPIPILFQDYADDHGATPEDFRNENAAFSFRISAGDAECSFEHDEEADDLALCDVDEFDESGLVFVRELIGKDFARKACIEIRGGTYFFQRGVKVRLGQGTYYLYFRELFSTDDSRPYVRRLGTNRLFSTRGPVSDTADCSMDIVKRFTLLSEMM